MFHPTFRLFLTLSRAPSKGIEIFVRAYDEMIKAENKSTCFLFNSATGTSNGVHLFWEAQTFIFFDSFGELHVENGYANAR